MKKLKILILIIILVIIILIVTSVILKNNYNNNTKKYENANTITEQNDTLEISDDEQVNNYFNEFKYMINNNLNDFYNKIDKDYYNEKFSNKNEYDNFLKTYINNWKNSEINNYYVDKTTGFNDFICNDKNNNYIIFRQKDNNYSIICDTYTIDIPGIQDKFKKSDKIGKIDLLISKIDNIIRCNDYEYLYNKLSENFKMDSFKELEDFKNYIINIEKQNVTFTTFNEVEEKNTYMFQLILQNDEDYYLTLDVVIKSDNINNFIIAFEEEE